jgi:hypothetical protein
VGLPGARKRFWETHANKLDKDNKLAVAKTEANRLAAAKAGDEFKKASQEFAEWLFLKDLNYVKAVVIGLGELESNPERRNLKGSGEGSGEEKSIRSRGGRPAGRAPMELPPSSGPGITRGRE